MTCSEEVEGRVRAHHPEAVVLAAEGVQARALRHVPHTHALVLRVAENELLAWMEHGARHVVVVSATSVHLPGFRVYKTDQCTF